MIGKILAQSAAIVALSAVAGCVTNAVHPKAPAFFLVSDPASDFSVTMEEVKSEWGGDVLWIDAREEKDFNRGHLPGALSLNHENYNELFLQHFETILTEIRPIVVYCSGEGCARSKKIAETLRDDDFMLENVYYLKGGWDG